MADETFTTDKTGAPVVVARAEGKFTVAFDGKAVDGKPVGLTAFAERDGQRIFYHTEVDDEFGGRGYSVPRRKYGC